MKILDRLRMRRMCSLPQWADMVTNDRNNGFMGTAPSVSPLWKNLESRVKEERKKEKKKHNSRRMCPWSLVLFVHFRSPAPSFASRAAARQNAQGNFTTTTQAPALPMLRGTSYRKTERLTCSLSSEAAFKKENPTLLHADKGVTGARLRKQAIKCW